MVGDAPVHTVELPSRHPDHAVGATALALFQHARAHLSPFKRIRRIEFADLPKTISGKIRRVELRRNEAAQRGRGGRGASEFWEEDFPELA